MDLGSAAYTEFEFDPEELIDLYEEKEYLMEWRCGLIHSHHHMQTFFSGTDQDELHEKAVNGLYLSLIVNNHLVPTAKLAWGGIVKHKRKATWVWGMFSAKGKELEEEETEVVYEVELDIEYASDVYNEMSERWDVVDEKDTIKTAAKFKAYVPGAYHHIQGGNQKDKEEDSTIERFKQGHLFTKPKETASSREMAAWGFGGEAEDYYDMRSDHLQKRLESPDTEVVDVDAEEIEAMSFVEQMDVVNLLDSTYPKIIAGELGFKGDLTEAFVEFIKMANDITDRIMTEKKYPKSQNAQMYKNVSKQLAIKHVKDGIDIVCEVLSTMIIGDEDYEEFLDSMRAELGDSGVAVEAFDDAIRTYGLDDD